MNLLNPKCLLTDLELITETSPSDKDNIHAIENSYLQGGGHRTIKHIWFLPPNPDNYREPTQKKPKELDFKPTHLWNKNG